VEVKKLLTFPKLVFMIHPVDCVVRLRITKRIVLSGIVGDTIAEMMLGFNLSIRLGFAMSILSQVIVQKTVDMIVFLATRPNV